MAAKEVVIAKTDELKNGEMKAVKPDEENEILLCRINDEFYAVGAHCPHYGAPLADGLLNEDRIICPWHHSCFNAKNGNLIEPPAFDALPQYELKVKKEKIYLVMPEEFKGSVTPSMVKPDTLTDKRKVVIIGGGAAGFSCAQTLREDGFKGSIIIITKEKRAPYDRPNLSKAYLSGEAPAEWMPLRSEEFYQAYGIDIMLEKEVTSVDHENNKIMFENGDRISYDNLLIATGGIPRKLNIPGSDLENIFYLRSFNDCEEIINASKFAKKLVVIGSSFIGMESAISIKERTDIDVTIVSPEKVPFAKIFGEEIGRLFQQVHEKHAIKFKLESKPSSFEGDGKVSAVLLENGERIDADMVIIGIGVTPATDFVKDLTRENGSLKVDNSFCVKGGIYAAGDIASFPSKQNGEYIRIEHWRTAEQQGRIAAHSMMGKKITDNHVPFFWTRQGDFGLEYVGHAVEWDEIKVEGDIQSKDFTARYMKDGKLIAAAGTREKEMAHIHELLRTNGGFF